MIRGYAVRPGGVLALDLHGSACGLYGFEACRKEFRIADDSFALVAEYAGAEAEARMAADRAGASGKPGDLAQAAPAPDSAAAKAGESEPKAGGAGEPAPTLTPSAGESLPSDLGQGEGAPETDGGEPEGATQ
ncbi:MAG: hypothetical protein D6801_02800 [Alphaproteobacteria bacterium]|nr:MAG: hypothetical protein D6801_02800 [Alphaproteobacteria bacterium]